MVYNLSISYKYDTHLFTAGCPVVDPDSFGICPEDCSSDSDCTNGQLCCSNGCGHVCMEPVPTDPCAVSDNGTYSYIHVLMYGRKVLFLCTMKILYIINALNAGCRACITIK